MDRRLTRIAAATGVGAAIIYFNAFSSVVWRRALFPAFPAGASPTEPWVALSIVLMGLALAAITRRPDSHVTRRGVASAAAVVFVASLVSLATHAFGMVGLGSQAGLLRPLLEALHAARAIGGTNLALASAALLLLALRRPIAAGIVASLELVFVVAAALSVIYGLPLVAGSQAAPTSWNAIAASVLLGTGLIAAGGTMGWPNYLFMGGSVRAILLRWLVPLIGAVVLITDIATNTLFTSTSPALGSAVNTVFSI